MPDRVEKITWGPEVVHHSRYERYAGEPRIQAGVTLPVQSTQLRHLIEALDRLADDALGADIVTLQLREDTMSVFIGLERTATDADCAVARQEEERRDRERLQELIAKYGAPS